MNRVPLLSGLCIESSLVDPARANFLPPTWPPEPDFPILIDANGNVVCRYGDAIWDLTLWASRPCTLNFCEAGVSRASNLTSKENADLLRRIMAWWLYGPRAVETPLTLATRLSTIRGVFVHCTRHAILASDLYRYPLLVDQLPHLLSPTGAREALALLESLFEERESLGFVILDRASLRSLATNIKKHEKAQTPFIPPRIWQYQVNRLRSCLEDLLAHQDQIKACFNFCLEAYRHNAKSLGHGDPRRVKRARKPFGDPWNCSGEKTGAIFYGDFEPLARRFGVDTLLRRWLLAPGESISDSGRGVQILSTYFTFIEYVGLAYLLNFSLMRIEEARALRADCLEVEHDELGDEIYLLCGVPAAKTQINNAKWITSPTAKVAVDAMTVVSRLRMQVAVASPSVAVTAADCGNPSLVTRPYEPWAGHAGNLTLPVSIRKNRLSYAAFLARFGRLLDPEELRVTSEDLRVARLFTPTLNARKFIVGQPWQLAWHQLRRTGAVNMLASGLVSDTSLQYQLKHTSLASTHYYAAGHHHLMPGLNLSAFGEYRRAQYEVTAREFAQLVTDRFVSPAGPARKREILSLVSDHEIKTLEKGAREGKVAFRQTLLGGCTNPDPCPYGGIDNVTRCGGGDGRAPCIDAVFDHDKLATIRQLKNAIDIRLLHAEAKSPLASSLRAQKTAVENALRVLGG